MERQLLIISHGYLAKELINSATMIIGEMENTTAICMTHDMGAEILFSQIQNYYNKYKNSDILVLADLYGGTPFNSAIRAKGDRDNIEILSGVNLGMVIEYATTQTESLTEIIKTIKETGKASIKDTDIETVEEVDF